MSLQNYIHYETCGVCHSHPCACDPLKKKILGVVQDSIGKLLYYDRKEDEDLEIGAIEDAILTEVVSIKELVELFQEELSTAVAHRMKANK